MRRRCPGCARRRSARADAPAHRRGLASAVVAQAAISGVTGRRCKRHRALRRGERHVVAPRQRAADPDTTCAATRVGHPLHPLVRAAGAAAPPRKSTLLMSPLVPLDIIATNGESARSSPSSRASVSREHAEVVGRDVALRHAADVVQRVVGQHARSAARRALRRRERRSRDRSARPARSRSALPAAGFICTRSVPPNGLARSGPAS